MPPIRFGVLALFTTLIAYACKESEPEPDGASGAGNSTSRAGASGGGKPSSVGGAGSGTGGRGGSSGTGGVGGHAGSVSGAGTSAGEAGGEAGAVGAGGNGGEAGAAGPVTLGDCSPNPCVVLATGQPWPRHLVVDSEYVYWTNEGTSANNYEDGAVMKVSLSGGEPIVAASTRDPLAITKDAKNLYWTTGYGVPNLMKMPIGGGEVETLATEVTSWGITVDGSQIYDSSYMGLGLLSVPVGGGTPEVIYPETAGNVVFDSKNLYFSTTDSDGSLTGVGRNNILVSMPKSGGDVTVLTSALDLPFAGAYSLVLASKSLYWGDAIRETVETVKLDGTGRRIIASNQHSVFGIGADANYVYWTSDRQAGVLKAPLDGSAEPVQIAKIPLKALWGLTLDADYIYVTVYDYMGAILKIKK